MGKRNKATQQLLRSSLALLTALTPLGWANALHAQNANSDARITSSPSGTTPKPSERYKNEPFWKSISDSDREILDHFGINAAAKLYRYAHGLELLLIKLGITIEEPLPREEEILEYIVTTHKNSELPIEMNQASKTLIQRFGFEILSTLNTKSTRLEDALSDALNRQKVDNPPKGEVTKRIQELLLDLQTKEEQSPAKKGTNTATHEKTITTTGVASDNKEKKTLLDLLKKAEGLKDRGDYQAAEKLLNEILETLKNQRDDNPRAIAHALAMVTGSLGQIAIKQGHAEIAEQQFKESVLLLETTQNPERAALESATYNLAYFYSTQNLDKQSESTFKRLIDRHKSDKTPGSHLVTRSYHWLADFYLRQGEYERAKEYYIAGIDHAKSSKSDAELWRMQANLGILYSRTRKHVKAAEIYEEALKNQGQGTEGYANLIGNLAELKRNQGSFLEAETIIQKALEYLPEQAPETIRLEEVYATVLNELDRIPEAISRQQRVLRYNIDTHGDKSIEAITARNNMAFIYLKGGDPERAISELKTAAKAIDGKTNDLAITLDRNLAYAYLNQGNPIRAKQIATKLLEESINRNKNPSTLSDQLILIGLIDMTLENWKEAESRLRQGLEAMNRWIIEELPLLPNEKRPMQIKALGDAWNLSFTLAARSPSAARLALEARLNSQGSLQEIERQQAITSTIQEASRKKRDHLQALIHRLTSISQASNQRKAINNEISKLQAQLYRAQSNLEVSTIKALDISRSLEGNGILIEFQNYRPFDGRGSRNKRWIPAQYLALILKPDGSMGVVELGPAAAIDATIHKALAASAQDQQDADILWAQLSEQLLKPLLPYLNGSRQWFVSPDGELNRVPFAALPAPQQPNIPLAEAVQLRLITTGRELVRLQKANPAGSKPLVMANPSFDRKGLNTAITTASTASPESRRRSADLGSTRWSPLPASQQEGQAIASLLSTNLVSGAAATTTTLQHQQGPRVLHIATHGFFVADQESKPTDPLRFVQEQAPQLQGLRQEDPQLRSGLVLAGANQPDADPNDDGYLTAAEAVMLNLKGTELVVLSACSTGQGDIRTGEGVYGLQRSLTVAGARSTLLSLWKVDDAATAEFMTRFYTRLKAGEARSDALAATQKEFRDGTAGNGQWTSPFYWAAWQLVGDWRPIRDL